MQGNQLYDVFGPVVPVRKTRVEALHLDATDALDHNGVVVVARVDGRRRQPVITGARRIGARPVFSQVEYNLSWAIDGAGSLRPSDSADCSSVLRRRRRKSEGLRTDEGAA